MRVRNSALAIPLALGLVLAGAMGAYAANQIDTNNDTDEGMRVTTTLLRDGKEFTCRGRTDRTNGGSANYIYVTTVCQFKYGNDWVDFGEPKKLQAYYTDTSGNETYVDNPCSASDGGMNLAPGDWKIRAQADGFWSTGGDIHRFFGPGAIETSADTVNCA